MILATAGALFLTQGYRDTSMRELAAQCDIGLGLITYYFKSKRELAKSCLQHHFQKIEASVNAAAPFSSDVLLYHATYLRYANKYFMHPKRRQLYYELLEEGIYSDYIYETVPHTLHELNTVFQAGLSEDYVLLYGNYVPMDLEKTLVLKKRDGLFRQISEDEIPTIVFENAVSHLVRDVAVTERAVEQSIVLCEKLMQQEEFFT